MVFPILFYGSEVWGTSCKIIEDVQIKMCKWFLKLGENTNGIMALDDCGRTPLRLVYTTRAIKYWYRLLQLSENGLPRQCYKMLRTLDENGHTSDYTN